MENNSILIDRYLQNQMDPAEKAGFEKQLSTDNELRDQLFIQQLVMKTAIDAGLKKEFSQAIRKKIITRRIIQLAIVAVIAIATFITYAIRTNLFSSAGKPKEMTKTSSPAEIYSINNANDTIIETKDGVVFAIPANAFKGGGNLDIQIKTALSPYDIMRQGLSTESNGSLLKTAGMFYINATADGKPVSLTKDISVSIPANEIHPGMQLFDGVEDKDGKINWVNPKPIDKQLRTYDIRTLDFYPAGYLPLLKEMQKDYTNRVYTDSLYYSFSGWPYSAGRDTAKTKPVTIAEGEDMPIGDASDHDKDTVGEGRPDQYQPTDTSSPYSYKPYEIDPGRIAAIWNEKFNNTILATKEFEERLRYLHTICNATACLNIYLQNLDKPLFFADERCYQKTKDAAFRKFAERKDGGVMITSDIQQKLSVYVQQKYKAYQQAALVAWDKYKEEYARLDRQVNTMNRQQMDAEVKRIKNNFDRELCINLVNAYKQIGITRECNDSVPMRSPSPYRYNVTISSTGWKNLDQYVYDATITRTSTSYTDPETGRTATLVYNPVNVTIENAVQFDKLFVYLIPDSLNSFQRMQQQGMNFTESLNSLLKYDLIAIGYKGTEVFYHEQKNIRPGDHVAGLTATDERSLVLATARYNKEKAIKMVDEFDYQLLLQRQAFLNAKWQNEEAFRSSVIEVIYPCYPRAK